MNEKFKVVYKKDNVKLGWNLFEMSYRNLMFGISITQREKNANACSFNLSGMVIIDGFNNVDVYLYNKQKDAYELYLENVSRF